MARGVNKVILVGNLGADPQVRYTAPPDSVAITNLSVATTRSWKDKATGQNQEQTEWHRVVLYNRLAEIAAEYLRKGAKVYIEGSLRTRKWQDNNGQDRYTTEIIGNEMQMLDRASGGRGDQAPHLMDESASGFSSSNRDYEPATASSPSSISSSGSTDFDDDIPF